MAPDSSRAWRPSAPSTASPRHCVYVYAVVTGLLDPTELVVAGIAAAVIAVAFLVHAMHVPRAMADHDDFSHRPMMDALHVQRERRGF